MLKALCPCLVVFSIDPVTETHLTKSLLFSEEENLFCINGAPVFAQPQLK